MSRRVPRASGDKPEGYDRIAIAEGVFPAPAGINRHNRVAVMMEARVPRASGDKPRLVSEAQSKHMCSPRQRG
ncbi:hypothetical protein JR388_003829 [Salmonella enterica subsp. enterica serovar Isangi]|nr:hypothetical protein [Salmonella enterica subsp. enterica serovar Isangi]EHD2005025.1 hypothetical protein [Salmonella enterica subsp. enterica serovar Isangi]EHD2014380.1 hypothetical protein [Salmonella enterica subsp. enterica serovar Isangi]EHD2089157.1 hypothetical protein [Salmonella enterica subsp. enterica serovar Isangi]